MLLCRVCALWCIIAIATAQFGGGGFDFFSKMFGNDFPSMLSPSTSSSGCGSYNRSTSICCGGQLRDSFGERVTGCCRTEAIDLRVSACCNGTTVPRIPSDDETGVDQGSCCGSQSYDRRNATCCGNGHLSVDFPEEHGACCGDEPYDSRVSMCCNGAPAPLRGDRGTGCCSRGVSYSFEDSVCCRGSVAPSYGMWHTRCCGSESYDSRSSSCCAGEVKDAC